MIPEGWDFLPPTGSSVAKAMANNSETTGRKLLGTAAAGQTVGSRGNMLLGVQLTGFQMQAFLTCLAAFLLAAGGALQSGAVKCEHVLNFVVNMDAMQHEGDCAGQLNVCVRAFLCVCVVCAVVCVCVWLWLYHSTRSTTICQAATAMQHAHCRSLA